MIPLLLVAKVESGSLQYWIIVFFIVGFWVLLVANGQKKEEISRLKEHMRDNMRELTDEENDEMEWDADDEFDDDNDEEDDELDSEFEDDESEEPGSGQRSPTK